MSFDAAAGREAILQKIRALPVGTVNIMEVCGTHTMAIAKAGLKRLLPENIRLLSGPGCPVCVTPWEAIDEILRLSEREGVLLASYGDMLRVPGHTPGDTLARRKALGAAVKIVYSAMDAVTLAEENPGKEVVFLGVGFETTAPGTAAAIRSAAEKGLKNFSALSLLKTVEPALRALIAEEGFAVHAFLCPGHVATIIGEKGFRFLPEEFSLPAVISGFEAEDILLSVWMLLKQLAEGQPRCENEYTRAVMPEGNPLAQRMTETVFEPVRAVWRGLGEIEASGLGIREKWEAWDAAKKFDLTLRPSGKKSACRCGEIIRGRLEPTACPLFGNACLPENPVGPCMVSSEGACAAAYKYRFL